MDGIHKRLLATCVAVAVAGLMSAGLALAQDGGGEAPAGQIAPAAINSNLVPEAKFVPLTPCRLLDTRSAGGRVNPNTVRGFDAFGTNLSSQGGSPSGCGVPSWADAIQVNLTAVDPLGTGYLRGARQNGHLIIYPDPGTSQTLPNATLLNYSSALNASNTVTLPLCGGDSQQIGGLIGIVTLCSGGKEFRLGAFTKATHIVADITGYYAVPPYASVAGGVSPTIVKGNDLGIVERTSAGTYTIGTPRDLRGCAFSVTVGTTDSGVVLAQDDLIAHVNSISATALVVEIYDVSNGAKSDSSFMVTATC